MKSLYMETTKKSPEQTISEIQGLLKPFKVRDILMKYTDNGEINAFSFTLEIDNQRIPFKLPIRHEPLWILAQRGETKYIKNEDQARRVAWRQIYRWLEAQLALVEIEMVKIEEVFLPYMMVDNDKTVYQNFLDNGFKNLLTDGRSI